ncbi:TOBE domain-containing protein [Streptomyces sp. GS7]|uniref:TOBE domain-containing protein n=1 Tax=Streptomyces sp. GS7 TaxID=2692234 RepID=UPI001318D06B|nr:hypothetical protein GR130_22830 [Streptomyces sp. GS7]
MSISIRHQIPGTVSAVTAGEAMALVQVRLASGQDITAAITTAAVDDLGLASGTSVVALIKSTGISLAAA